MRLTQEQFSKRTLAIEERKKWIEDDMEENKKHYRKEDFIKSREDNMKIFYGKGMPYELILNIFKYCDILTCIKFGLWEYAILVSGMFANMSTPKQLDLVKFIHYFDIKKVKVCWYHDIECVKFIYYNTHHYNSMLYSYISTYSNDIETIDFLLYRYPCISSLLYDHAKTNDREVYKYIRNHPNPWELQLSCNSLKRDGFPCLNKAKLFGLCGVHS